MLKVSSSQYADKLLYRLEKVDEDTVKVNILNNLCKEYWGSKPEKAKAYGMQALQLATKIDYGKGIARSYLD